MPPKTVLHRYRNEILAFSKLLQDPRIIDGKARLGLYVKDNEDDNKGTFYPAKVIKEALEANKHLGEKEGDFEDISTENSIFLAQATLWHY